MVAMKKKSKMKSASKAAEITIEDDGITATEIIDKLVPDAVDAMVAMKKKSKMKSASKAAEITIEDDGIKATEIIDKLVPDAVESVNDNDDDDAPEIVTSNREDIKRLRDLHEQMMLPAEKRTKKRKVIKNLPIIANVKKISEEEELDDSVLAALDGLNEQESSARDGDNNGRTDAEEFKKMTRTLSKRKRKGIINIHAKKSRKIGNIDVEVLVETENVLSAYALPKAALSFAAALTSSRPRTNYASFSSQRHIGPCSKFTAQDHKLLKKPA